MPRQSSGIRDFKYGVISSVDEEDIPIESASDNLNVDGDVGEGILRGIPADTEKLIDTGDADLDVDDALVSVRLGEMLEDEGTYTLIYHDSANNKISSVQDFYGAVPTQDDILTTTVSDNTTMVKSGKEVHIGTGYASTNLPRWIGHIDWYQFGLVAANYTDGFVGSGLDDMTGVITGYKGSQLSTYVVEITANTPDLFSVTKDGVLTLSDQEIAGEAQAIGDGVSVDFNATSGHTIGDYWTVTTLGYYYNGSQISINNQVSVTAAVETAGTGEKFFKDGTTYMWTLSAIYDGYQESPLYTTPITDDPAQDSEYYTLTIIANGAVNAAYAINRRITGYNVYRTEYLTSGQAKNRGLYRLVASIDVNSASWATETLNRSIYVRDYGTVAAVGTSSTFGDTLNYGGITYDENSGISETIISTSVNYALSTSGNGYHFVGKCYKSNLPDAARFIFRSKYLRFDMFDWTSDFLVMPEDMTAMHFYEGKLFVFSLTKVYRIDPNGLFIEDVFDDAGAQGQRAVHSNESGMFFGNISNAWMYRGGTFSRIGDAIRQSASGGKSWKTFLFTTGTSTLDDLIVTSDTKKGYVLFINERDATPDPIFAWAYHPEKQRWDAWAFGGYTSDANAGTFKGKDGEVYLSIAAHTYQLMRPSTATYTQAWEWYSQELSFGETRQIKSLSMIKTDSTGSVTITYGVDGATPASAGTSEALINVYNKSIRIKLNAAAVGSGTAYTNFVDSMEVLYRPLVGKR